MISVIVPIHNVAPYLQECLDSIAAQTFGDLDVVMVDDGSTDDSPAIATAQAAADPRFRLVQQDNAGLGAARNTGVEHARGDQLAFVDSDDLVPPTAYAQLHASLESTGSDFASGNARRIWSQGTRRVQLLAPVCARTRLRTHIREFPVLIRDRVAWNKLIQRSFWDAHGLRFGEGVTYEDIYVTLPAHHLARTVDVLSAPVYYWRIRESGPLSITQRRTEVAEMRNRIAAIDYVSRWLAGRGLVEEKRRYDDTVLTDDLRFFFAAVTAGADEDRLQLIDEVNAFFDQTRDDVFDRLPAVRRLAWHFVRRRLLPELLEVLRFEREELRSATPVHTRRGWYGDYPYRSDRRLRVPREIYRLDDELAVSSTLSGLAIDATSLRVEGAAFIDPLGARRPQDQQLGVVATPTSGGAAHPLTVLPQPVRSFGVAGPAVPGGVSGAGFAATLDLAAMPAGEWRIDIEVRRAGLRRTTQRHRVADLLDVTPVEEPGHDVVAGIGPDGRLLIEVGAPRARLRSLRLAGGFLELEIECPDEAGGQQLVLQLGRAGARRQQHPLEPAGRLHVARIPVAGLAGELARPDVPERAHRLALVAWDLTVRRKKAAAWPVTGAAPAPILAAGQEWLAGTHRVGRTLLVQRAPRPVVTSVGPRPDGGFDLAGRLSQAGPTGRLVLVDATGAIGERPVELDEDAATGTFRTELAASLLRDLIPVDAPAATRLPRTWLPGTTWLVRAAVDPALGAALPVWQELDDVVVAVGVGDFAAPVVAVRSPEAVFATLPSRDR